MRNAALLRKEDALIACLDALAPINSLDCTYEDAFNALLEGTQAIASYPGIDCSKRLVLKEVTADHKAAFVQHLLQRCLLGETLQTTLAAINKALSEALEMVQAELKVFEKIYSEV